MPWRHSQVIMFIAAQPSYVLYRQIAALVAHSLVCPVRLQNHRTPNAEAASAQPCMPYRCTQFQNSKAVLPGHGGFLGQAVQSLFSFALMIQAKTASARLPVQDDLPSAVFACPYTLNSGVASCVCHSSLNMSVHHAEGVGGVIAGLIAAPLYGVGATWLTGLVPWQKRTESPDGPSRRLVDHAASLERKKNRAYKYQHRATDSASSPEAEQQPLETIV